MFRLAILISVSVHPILAHSTIEPMACTNLWKHACQQLKLQNNQPEQRKARAQRRFFAFVQKRAADLGIASSLEDVFGFRYLSLADNERKHRLKSIVSNVSSLHRIVRRLPEATGMQLGEVGTFAHDFIVDKPLVRRHFAPGKEPWNLLKPPPTPNRPKEFEGNAQTEYENAIADYLQKQKKYDAQRAQRYIDFLYRALPEEAFREWATTFLGSGLELWWVGLAGKVHERDPNFVTSWESKIFPKKRKQTLNSILHKAKELLSQVSPGLKQTISSLDTRLRWPSDESLGLSFTFRNVGYLLGALHKDGILINGGFAKEKYLTALFILTHELGHAIHANPSPLLTQETQHLDRCLLKSYRRYTELSQPQLEEARSDWYAVEALVRRIQNSKMSRRLQRTAVLQQVHSCQNLKRYDEILAISVTPPHPRWDYRTNAIALAHPYVRGLFGCAPPKRGEYCAPPHRKTQLP